MRCPICDLLMSFNYTIDTWFCKECGSVVKVYDPTQKELDTGKLHSNNISTSTT